MLYNVHCTYASLSTGARWYKIYKADYCLKHLIQTCLDTYMLVLYPRNLYKNKISQMKIGEILFRGDILTKSISVNPLGKPQKKVLFLVDMSTKAFTPLGLVVIRNFFFFRLKIVGNGF